MTAQLIDGNALSRQLRTQVAERVSALKAQGLTPGLAVILVGENPASQVYVRNKVKACEDTGMHSVLETYGADMTEAELLARVDAVRPHIANAPMINASMLRSNSACCAFLSSGRRDVSTTAFREYTVSANATA